MARSSRLRAKVSMVGRVYETLLDGTLTEAKLNQTFDSNQASAATQAVWMAWKADGTGARALADGASETIDLTEPLTLGLGSDRDMVGAPTGFSTIHTMMVRNVGPGTLRIFGEGSSESWNGPVGSDTVTWDVEPGGWFEFQPTNTALFLGFAVNSGAKLLKMAAVSSSGALRYDILLKGAEA